MVGTRWIMFSGMELLQVMRVHTVGATPPGSPSLGCLATAIQRYHRKPRYFHEQRSIIW